MQSGDQSVDQVQNGFNGGTITDIAVIFKD
jgi:hypothetical protein